MNKRFVAIATIIIIIIAVTGYLSYNDPHTRFTVAKMLGLKKAPQKMGENVDIEEYLNGLNGPTTMAFVGKDIIFLEKNSGLVRFIKDGKILDESLFDFSVANQFESGLLGILVVNSDVYLYVTESTEDGGELQIGRAHV